ncbi:adenylate kinase [Dactylosporangium sp. NPDC000555]|uniref:adenylate kinase n=1 Tax=Dactylosporangium sp. NPDC000555 TaxID=3154260 RepID=UPI0033228AA6
MRVLMVAPPGAGKGTQGAAIAAHFRIQHLAVGDLLRRHVLEGTEIGRDVRGHLDRGELVPDGIVLELLRQGLTEAKRNGGGYVLDGIPRTMDQAVAAYRVALALGMTADVALHLEAGDEELMRRLRKRAAIEHRSDDDEAVIRRRLQQYHEVTQPVLAFYAQRGILLTVDATPPADVVTRDVLAALTARAARTGAAGRVPGTHRPG